METQHLSCLQAVHQVPFGIISCFHIRWRYATKSTRLGEYPRIKTLLDMYGHRSVPFEDGMSLDARSWVPPDATNPSRCSLIGRYE
jgi:hypothetical protein